MPPRTVYIESKIVGSSPDREKLSPVSIELVDERLTARELIIRAVEEQIRDLTLIRKLDNERAFEILARQYLSEEDVTDQAADGAIRYAPKFQGPPDVSTHREVNRALSAFEAGRIIVMVDGRQVERLDEVLTLGLTSKVTFIRLVALVGG